MTPLTYQDEVADIIDGFEYELCEECEQDIDAHVIAPDPFGHAHAWCQIDAEAN